MLGVKLDYNMSAWKKTLIAGLISYIDAGSIVAGASGLSMWAEYLGMSSVQMGLLAALSSNTGGAALGALIGVINMVVNSFTTMHCCFTWLVC